jgi:hypothetical protein
METLPGLKPVKSPDTPSCPPKPTSIAMSSLNTTNAAHRAQLNCAGNDTRNMIIFPRNDLNRDRKTYSLPQMTSVTKKLAKTSLF